MRGMNNGRMFFRLELTPKLLAILSMVLLLVVSLWLARPASAAVLYRDSAAGDNGGGSTTVTIAKPATAAIDDVMIAVIATRGGTGTTVTPPSGWTSVITTDSGTTIRNAVYYRVVVAGDPSSYIFTLSATSKAAGIIAAYSGVDIYNPINLSAGQANASGTTMTAPSITTQVPNAMLVALYSNATATTFAAGSGMTLRNQTFSSGGGQAGTKVTVGMQEVIQASAGVSGTKTMTATNGAINVGQLLALRPVVNMEQASYRFFQNNDSASVSTPLANTDTPISIDGGTPFRLRLNLGVPSGGSSATAVAARTFRLQYSSITDGTCDTAFSGESYTNMSAISGAVRFHNNTTPASGSAYSANATYDPIRSGVTALSQKYYEDTPLDLATSIPAGQDGLWDFSLTTSGASPGQTFCIRVQQGTANSNLATYLQIPKITIAAPTVTQANYRFFANADSLTPGLPLVTGQDIAATVAHSTPFRLRQRLAVGAATLPLNGQNYKLQYAEKVGVCDVGFSGETYADIASGATPTTTGTVYPSNATTDAEGGGYGWVNAQSIFANDSIYASATAPTAGVFQTTAWLVGSNYGLTVPSDATINGIEVTIPYIIPTSQTVVESTLASLGTSAGMGYPTVTNGNTFGSSTDKWGLTLTPAVVNNTGFSIRFQATLSDDLIAPEIDVDSMPVIVYYTPAGSNAPVQRYVNVTVGNGATISSSGNDPVNGARPTVYQSYRETDPFTNNVSSIPNGSDGLWDFTLTSGAAANGKTYCFRIVKSDGTPLDTYSQIPEVTFTSGGGSGPTLDQQMRGGGSVLNGLKGNLIW